MMLWSFMHFRLNQYCRCLGSSTCSTTRGVNSRVIRTTHCALLSEEAPRPVHEGYRQVLCLRQAGPSSSCVSKLKSRIATIPVAAIAGQTPAAMSKVALAAIVPSISVEAAALVPAVTPHQAQGILPDPAQCAFLPTPHLNSMGRDNSSRVVNNSMVSRDRRFYCSSWCTRCVCIPTRGAKAPKRPRLPSH